jgi:hypothetical protein
VSSVAAYIVNIEVLSMRMRVWVGGFCQHNTQQERTQPNNISNETEDSSFLTL